MAQIAHKSSIFEASIKRCFQFLFFVGFFFAGFGINMF